MVHRLGQNDPEAAERTVRLCDEQFDQLVALLTPGAVLAKQYVAEQEAEAKRRAALNAPAPEQTNNPDGEA